MCVIVYVCMYVYTYTYYVRHTLQTRTSQVCYTLYAIRYTLYAIVLYPEHYINPTHSGP
jgi:hypothetical protein